MTLSRKTLLFLAIFIAACVAYFYSFSSPADPAYTRTTLRIGETSVDALLADTPALTSLGLSGREKLEENEGMFFIFSEPQPLSFWMKDMRFPIDIIWIDERSTVVGISNDLEPETFPQTFSPSVPAQYALEVNAGFAEKHGVVPGAKVEGISR